jgi:CheY-like chemotaxis protein
MSERTILIVEDHPDMSDIIRAQLVQIGYPRSLCARTGPEAVKKIHEERPDLILMDIRLPGINGLDVARSLKTDPGTRSIPILGMTAGDAPRNQEMCRESGCDGYLPKPFFLPRLKAEIEKLLTRSS